MLKKILITFLIVPVVGGAIYGYFYFKQVKTPLTPVLKAIPDNAVCITEAHDFSETWKSFSEENSIWKELLNIESLQNINKKVNFFDSVFVHGREVLKIKEDTKIYLSVHADTAQGVDFLLAFNIPLTAERRAVNEIIEKAIPVMYTKSDTMVAGIAVHQYKLRDGKKFYYYLNNMIFALSYSPDLIEQSARTLVSDVSLMQNNSFAQVLKTTGNQSKANVFVNFKNLSGIMPQYLNEENRDFVNIMSNFAQWISMDLNFKKDIIVLNGFSYSSDSLHDFLSLFKSQNAPKIELTNVLPTNTAFFTYTGVSDASKYIKELNRFNNTEGKQKQNLKELESKFGIDLNAFFNSWVGNEMASVYTETYGDYYAPDKFAVFKARDINKALNAFSELNQSVQVNIGNSESENEDTEEYRNHKIYPLQLSSILPMIFGKSFPDFAQHYYMALKDYIIISDNQAALRSLLNFYLADRTLAKDKDYKKFAESLSDNTNFFIYSAVARSPQLLSKQVDKKLSKEIEKNVPLFRKFQSLALQFKGNGNLFYNNLCLKYNPVYLPEFNTLWDIENDTTFITPPFLIKNPLDSSDMFVLQDANLKLHVYDKDGKQVWEKSLNERVLGKIHQTNVQKNGNYVLAFVSESYLYLIDNNGNDVGQSPTKLQAKATTGLGCINLRNDEEPLLLVACDNLIIYNYSTNGKLDKDWYTERLKAELKGEFMSIYSDGREMICFADKELNLRLIDKKGNWVVRFKEKLPGLHNNMIYTDIKKTLSASSIFVSDDEGVVYRYNFKGKFDAQQMMPKLGKNFYFTYSDLDYDGNMEYIYADGKRLNVLNKDRTVKFNFNFNSDISGMPQIISLSDTSRLLAVSTLNEGLFIINSEGELNRGTSLAGVTPITITAIEKLKYHFIVTTYGRRLLAHAIEVEKPEKKVNLP